MWIVSSSFLATHLRYKIRPATTIARITHTTVNGSRCMLMNHPLPRWYGNSQANYRATSLRLQATRGRTTTDGTPFSGSPHPYLRYLTHPYWTPVAKNASILSNFSLVERLRCKHTHARRTPIIRAVAPGRRIQRLNSLFSLSSFSFPEATAFGGSVRE